MVLLLFRKAHSQPQANPNSSPEAVRAQAWAASLFLAALSEPGAAATGNWPRIFTDSANQNSHANSLISIVRVNSRLIRSATLDRLTAIEGGERLEFRTTLRRRFSCHPPIPPFSMIQLDAAGGECVAPGWRWQL